MLHSRTWAEALRANQAFALHIISGDRDPVIHIDPCATSLDELYNTLPTSSQQHPVDAWLHVPFLHCGFAETRYLGSYTQDHRYHLSERHEPLQALTAIPLPPGTSLSRRPQYLHDSDNRTLYTARQTS